jgi:hypothetical protein
MQQDMLPQIDHLIAQLTELRAEFENGISNGKSYAEVKAIYLHMKELLSLLQQLQESGRQAAAN